MDKRKRRFLAAGATSAALALVMAGCSSSGGSGEGAASESALATPDGSGKTLTVWAMNGDLTDDTLKAINDEFEKATGAKVDVQLQQWDGITTKITTALATDDPPDVLDLGNTQVAGYAANGGLLDLTSLKGDLSQGRTWLGGLEQPATIDGALYGVPSFAGTRSVIYNKKTWAAAGITEPPTTYEELTADLDKIKAANSANDFSAFYMPGQYWYAGLQWIWDAGGEVATQDGDTWKGSTSGAESVQALSDWKEFQNTYSSEASRTLDTIEPDQDQLFADGKTATVLGNGWEIGVIQKNNPDIKDEDLGTFPFPGTSGENQPVMLAGSVWGIAAKSQEADLAKVWVKIAASPEIQDTYVYGKEKWIPNSDEGRQQALESSDFPELQKGFFEAAENSRATPASPNWSTIEGDKSINQLFSSIASGTATPEEAAKTFDAHLDETLGQG